MSTARTPSPWFGTTSAATTVDPFWERFVLGAAIVLATVIGLILATGHLTALLLDGSWPRYELAEAPRLLSQVVAEPSDPARAWTEVAAVGGGRPAGPLVWWVTFVALAGLAGYAAWTLGTYNRRRSGPAAAWARQGDLRRLRPRRRAGSVTLGRTGRRSVALEARHSLLIWGPTQSGKTTSLAVPAILEWPGPVVATSTKGDLVADTIGWRSQLGDVHVYDPARSTTFQPAGWSPLAGCDTWAGATAAAWELAMAGKACLGSGMALADFWFPSAAKSLAPYLHAAACSRRDVGALLRWIDAEERDEVERILRMLHPDAALAHQATFKREDKSRSSLFQVMQQILAAYGDPAVAASAAHHDIDMDKLLDGGAHTLYVTAPLRDQKRFRPLFSTVIGQLLAAVYSHAARTGEPLDPPLLLVLDEAANIAPVEDLPEVASTAAALGLQLVTVFQDNAQIKRRYGDAAGTIVNNHRAKLLLPGVSDVETLELASRLAGDHEIDRHSSTTDATGRRSRTTAGQWRRLLPVELARTLEDGFGVLLYGNLPPIRLRLRPWYRTARLRRRAHLEPLEPGFDLPENDDHQPGLPKAGTAHEAALQRLRRAGEAST